MSLRRPSPCNGPTMARIDCVMRCREGILKATGPHTAGQVDNSHCRALTSWVNSSIENVFFKSYTLFYNDLLCQYNIFFYLSLACYKVNLSYQSFLFSCLFRYTQPTHQWRLDVVYLMINLAQFGKIQSWGIAMTPTS